MQRVLVNQKFEIVVFEENRAPRKLKVTAEATVADVLQLCKIKKLDQINCYFGDDKLDRPVTHASLNDTFVNREVVTHPKLGYIYWLRASVPSLWVGYTPRDGQTKLNYNWLLSKAAYDQWKASRDPKFAAKLMDKQQQEAAREAKRVANIRKTHPNMERLGRKYSVEEVLAKIMPQASDEEAKVDFDGDFIKMNSQRYNTFARSGVKCVRCGLEGTFFAKERSVGGAKRYHFNLYGIDAAGDEVMLTKDHIVPRSKGGKDRIDNYQTMCKVCNERKCNKMEPHHSELNTGPHGSGSSAR